MGAHKSARRSAWREVLWIGGWVNLVVVVGVVMVALVSMMAG